VFLNDSIEGIPILEMQQLVDEAYIYVRHGRELVSIPKLGENDPMSTILNIYFGHL